jgi:tetrahydromethanopterin S-methyltransferase subunit D
MPNKPKNKPKAGAQLSVRVCHAAGCLPRSMKIHRTPLAGWRDAEFPAFGNEALQLPGCVFQRGMRGEKAAHAVDSWPRRR